LLDAIVDLVRPDVALSERVEVVWSVKVGPRFGVRRLSATAADGDGYCEDEESDREGTVHERTYV
jgi:hypothetical protein